MPGPVHEWWPKISEESRQWITTHLRETLPEEVANDIFKQKGYLVGEPNSENRWDLSSIEWDEIEHPR